MFLTDEKCVCNEDSGVIEKGLSSVSYDAKRWVDLAKAIVRSPYYNATSRSRL